MSVVKNSYSLCLEWKEETDSEGTADLTLTTAWRGHVDLHADIQLPYESAAWKQNTAVQQQNGIW